MQINRSIFNVLSDDLFTETVSILMGARQVGKSYLLRQLEQKAKDLGKKTAFFDLEQPTDLLQFNCSDAEIIERLVTAGEVVFMDEFHYLKNASRIFKAIVDRRAKVKIFASGSSASEMHAHLKESLVGRKRIYRIHPCNLDELHPVLSGQALAYMSTFGGMPGTLKASVLKEKQIVLQEILQSYLLKDVKALIREENLRAFNHLLYLLAQFQGSLVSTAGLAKEVGLSARTIEMHLEILTQTYVLAAVSSYSRNLGNELRKSKKYYLYDLGIRNALLKNFAGLKDREDGGAIVETIVFHELEQQLTPDSEIRFWRTKAQEEVDFIWVKNQKPFPIEVKLTLKKPEIPDGLRAFLRRYPRTSRAFVVSNHRFDDRVIDGIQICFREFSQAAAIPTEI